MRRRTSHFLPASAMPIVALGLLFAPAGTGLAQAPQQPRAGLKAANDWMTVPTPASAPSDVPADLRARRDQYFDDAAVAFGFTKPLTAEDAGWGLSEGSRVASKPDITPVPLRSVVIGRFESSRAILSASGRAVYTEIKIRVTDLFEDTSGRIGTEPNITLSFMGGAVKTNDGTVISLFTNPRRYSLEPGRSYLLVLQFRPAAELYTVVSNWDFTAGIVSANSTPDRQRELRGGGPNPSILGLNKEQLIGYLNEQLKK